MSLTKKRKSAKKKRSKQDYVTRSTKRQSMKTTPQPPSQPQSRGQRFRYAPLNPDKTSIRLIRVSPDLSVDGLIQCSMFNDQLRPDDLEERNKGVTRSHPYHCLSYTWGDQSNKRQIRINTKLHYVGQNLWEFLHALRRYLRSAPQRIGPKYSSDTWHKAISNSYIWIDALCINQNDKAERSQQVQRMGQIYQIAEMVLIWLGNDPKVKSAVETLHNSEESSMPMSGNYPTFKNLRYWSRAWIVQEIALAHLPVIFFKSGVYDFRELRVKMDIETGPNEEWTAASKLVSYLTEWKGTNFPRIKYDNVLQVLNSLGTSRKCKDNQDQIYSVLAMSINQDDIIVNYGISTAKFAKQVLIACKESVCLCSTSILLRALNLQGEPSLYVEMDVPRQSCWSESPRKCKECNDDVLNSSKEKPVATLCLRTMCSTFKGHLYALSKEPCFNHQSSTFRSSRLHFTTGDSWSKKTCAMKVDGVSIGVNAPGAQDVRHRWRITVHSFMKMARLEKLSGGKPVMMCLRSEIAKGCGHCAHGQQINEDATRSSWNKMDMQSLPSAIPLTHRTLSCTLLSSARYELKFDEGSVNGLILDPESF